MKKTIITSAVVAITLLGAWIFVDNSTQTILPVTKSQTVTYSCDQGKTITVTYIEGPEAAKPAPGEPPVPTGSAEISLNGQSTSTLHQTISADGARFANKDESLVVWNKGDQVMVLRSDAVDLEYRNCTEQHAFDGKNTTFTIDGQSVTLVNGVSEVLAAPGSASKTTTRYFGNEAVGDLTGDGISDTAFLVTQDSGGSGVFYYAVVAMKTTDGYKNTNAFFVGDRIAPQSNYIPKNSQELQVNYAERKPGEPMSAQPSVGAVLLLKVTPTGVLEGLMK